TASPAGDLITGQDGFYAPVAGSLDRRIFTYAGNPLGVPQNPNGGASIYAGVSDALATPPRAQRALTWPHGRLLVAFDVRCNYAGTGTPTQNLGSLSFQPSTSSVYLNLLARWPVGVVFPPTTWNADFVDGTGAQI